MRSPLAFFEMTGGAEAEHELALLNPDDWSFEATDRAAAWLASVASGADGQTDLVPEPIRSWVSARRDRFANDGLVEEAVEIVLPLDDRATLSIRHLFAGRPAARDSLLLRRQTREADASWDAFRLTPREGEILQAAAGGLTNRALGERFSISERTVEKHFSHIYEKLAVRTRTAAVSLALRGRTE